MEKINKLKSQVQKEILKIIHSHHGWGTIAVATGVGKSKVAIDYSKQLKKGRNTFKVLIVVPTEKLRDENWKEEFTRWDASDIWDNYVDRACYVSINKIHNEIYDLVILDEGHNITENNVKFFDQNAVTKCLLLSATPPKNPIKIRLLQKLKLDVIYELPVDKAVERGLVSPYKIKVIYLDLNDKDKNIDAGNKTNRFKTTEKKQYEYLSKLVDHAMLVGDPNRHFKIFRRMRFVYDLKTKTDAAQYLLENIIPKEDRTIIFAGGIKQSEQLNEYFFHSKTNDKWFKAFKEKEINQLACVNSLNEGHNLVDVDRALVVQLNSKQLNLIQRIGRTIRYRKGHEATIYILVVRETVDMKWASSALRGFNSENIEYIDYIKDIRNDDKQEIDKTITRK